MGVGEKVQAPPRAVATAVRGRQSKEPGKEAGWQQGQRLEPGCWSSVCGVSHSPHTNPPCRKHSVLPKSAQNFPGTWALLFKLPHPPCPSFISPHFPPTLPPLYCLPGAVVGDRNVTARIGKPLVLNCRGAPKKPPQQLEWKLVSRAPVTASPLPERPAMICIPTSLPQESFPKGPALLRPLSSVPRTQAEQKLGRSCLPREVPGIV